jgi:hypothetical protein
MIYGMAERTVIVCEPLGFLINRFSTTQLKLLKNVVVYFYSVEVTV